MMILDQQTPDTGKLLLKMENLLQSSPVARIQNIQKKARSVMKAEKSITKDRPDIILPQITPIPTFDEHDLISASTIPKEKYNTAAD